MKTGLVSVSFRGLTPEEIIPLAARCSLKCIEWGGDVHVPVGEIERALQVGEMTRRAGLEVACYGSYYRLTDGEGAPDDVVATAKALGAPLIRVWAGMLPSADASEEYRKMIVRNTCRIADIAAGENIDIAFEFHGNTLTDNTESALRLLEDAGRSNVYTLWQPPVDMTDDDCRNSLRAVLPRLRNLHVFTWAGRQRLPLDRGEAKWKPLLAEVARLVGEHCLMLEFVQNDAPEQLAADAACLNRWLEEII